VRTLSPPVTCTGASDEAWEGWEHAVEDTGAVFLSWLPYHTAGKPQVRTLSRARVYHGVGGLCSLSLEFNVAVLCVWHSCVRCSVCRGKANSCWLREHGRNRRARRRRALWCVRWATHARRRPRCTPCTRWCWRISARSPATRPPWAVNTPPSLPTHPWGVDCFHLSSAHTRASRTLMRAACLLTSRRP
jgi:hypothetical protein